MTATRSAILAVLLFTAVIMLSGCMYGDRIKKQGAPASGEYIALVQSAMEQYRAKTGVLPIQNKEGAASEYERYRIDFKKLQDNRFLTAVPVNAFENGGSAIYVVARTETVPQVKLLDLVSFQQIAELQQSTDRYKSSHGGELPLGEKVAPGFWQLDYRKLNMGRPEIRSPYSMNIKLYPVINESGTVGIDYTPELQRVIQNKSLKPASGQDLRELLLDDGYFVPACSFPYRWNGQAPELTANLAE